VSQTPGTRSPLGCRGDSDLGARPRRFEAALQACRPASPDYEYYRQVARRIDHNRACPSVARKLCRRAFHILRELGDEALAPIEPAPLGDEVTAAAA
jgi:transposase